VLKVTT